MGSDTLHIPVRWEAVELVDGKHQIRVWINGRRGFDLIWDPETKTLKEVPVDDKNQTHA